MKGHDLSFTIPETPLGQFMRTMGMNCGSMQHISQFWAGYIKFSSLIISSLAMFKVKQQQNSTIVNVGRILGTFLGFFMEQNTFNSSRSPSTKTMCMNTTLIL